MNRAQRRRLQKQGQTVKREPTLNLKVSDLERAAEAAKKRATDAAIHEIDRQILERDAAYSLDVDSMVLWALHVHCGWGKVRLERFYRAMLQEHLRMREYYELDDTFPERYLLKERYNVDVEALNKEFLDRL